METVRENISLEEEALLVHRGAEGRFACAKAALDEFVLEHGDPRIQLRASSFEHRDSLEKEFRALLVEHDDAGRHFQKSLADWSAVKQQK